MTKSADWMKMLDQLNTALAQTSGELSGHEQALASPWLTSDLSGERHISWQRALDRFGERLQDCQTQVQQAERQSEQAEAALAQHEEELTRFRSKVTEIRQILGSVHNIAVE
jgi:chromosome segregation ATPase